MQTTHHCSVSWVGSAIPEKLRKQDHSDNPDKIICQSRQDHLSITTRSSVNHHKPLSLSTTSSPFCEKFINFQSQQLRLLPGICRQENFGFIFWEEISIESGCI